MQRCINLMRERLLRVVDRGVIQFAASRMPRPGRREPHLAEAEQLLQSPGFFHETVGPAALKMTTDQAFEFLSPVETPFAENNRVVGRFYHSAADWQKKPAVILLHGWNDLASYRLRYPLTARRLGRAGINAAILALPYHFERKPTPRAAIHNILSEDILRTVEGIQQAVADVRAMAAWLLKQGCPSVGVWGVSMGAWIGGLALCHDPRIDFGVLMTPVVLMDRVIREVEFVAAIRHAVKDKPIDFSKLNLTSYKPLRAREKVLLVEAQYDQFVPSETVEALWEHWNRPDIWRLPHGHISVLTSIGLINRSVKWVAGVSAPTAMARAKPKLA